MNIALLVKRFTCSGGKERYVVELAMALNRRGHTVHIYGYACDADLPPGITFHEVARGMAFSSVLNTLSFIRASRNRLAGSTHDIVHAHERNDSQELATLHSFSFLHGIDGYRGLKRLDQKYLSLRSLLYQGLEKRQMRTPWLVAVSAAVARDVQTHYGRTRRIICIPPGVDVDRFAPSAVAPLRDGMRRAHHLQRGEMAVLFVGSAFQRKGLDRVLPAIGDNRRLFVVGKGDRHGRYRRLIDRLGIQSRVVFTDLVDDVVPYYALADVVVLPSRSEAFGMSILEAMACGLPVVVTANAGVADLIAPGDNGLIMHTDADLADHLDRLAQADARRQLGANARRTALTHTWDHVGQQHEALYRQIIAERGST